jgi:hypothetical protein
VEATPWWKAISRQKALFRAGLLIYSISFALFWGGCRLPGCGPSRGYLAAFFAFVLPLKENPFSVPWLFHDMIFEYVALVISGWINPVFLIVVALMLRGRYQRTEAILRIILLLMVPFCWAVFYDYGFYPREGYFLWLFGMLLALFSSVIMKLINRLVRNPDIAQNGRGVLSQIA